MNKQPSRSFTKAVLLTSVFALAVIIVRNTTTPQASPIRLDVETNDASLLLTDRDSTNAVEEIERNAPKISKDETPFIVTDAVQQYVLGHCRLRITRHSRFYVAGRFQIKRSGGNIAKFAFSSSRKSQNGKMILRFFLLSSSSANAKKLYKFRGFVIVANGGGTSLIVYPNSGKRASMTVQFRRGKKLTLVREKLYNMFLQDLIVGSFIELDIKLGAAGFIGNRNLPVAAISFYANSFAIQAKRVSKLLQWEIDEQEVAKANEMVQATQTLGRSPTSVEEMENLKEVSRRRMIACWICPICCALVKKDKCSIEVGCGNPCLGMCGKDCSCWRWVCGNCKCHCNCRDHDIYCSCMSLTHPECLNLIKYSNCKRRCKKSLKKHIRKAPLQRGSRYAIISVHSKKAMEIRDGNSNKGSSVVQWQYHKFQNQIWVFDPNALRGRGYYHVQNYQSRLYWDVYGNRKHNGAKLIQWSRHNGANQKFLFQRVRGNIYRIRPQSVGKYLDVAGWSRSNNGRIHIWNWHGGNNQLWIIKPIDSCNMGRNVARGRPASQISQGWHGNPRRAVDGNRNGNYGSNSCTHTQKNRNSWWYVDIGRQKPVCSVKIWNRRDCCKDRLQYFKVFVTNRRPSGRNFRVRPHEVCGVHSRGVFDVKQIKCGRPLQGRFVGVQLMRRNYLTICEFEVFVQS